MVVSLFLFWPLSPPPPVVFSIPSFASLNVSICRSLTRSLFVPWDVSSRLLDMFPARGFYELKVWMGFGWVYWKGGWCVYLSVPKGEELEGQKHAGL